MAAHALINGLQLLTCVTPVESEKVCAVYAEAEPELKVMPDYGKFEVSVLFYASSSSVSNPVLVGELEVDGSAIIPLGRLPSGNDAPTIVSRFFKEKPRSFVFRISVNPVAATRHPDEDVFLEEVKLLLGDHTLFPVGGSAPHSNVHNRVKELEVYQRVVVQHYGTRWVQWIANHADSILLVKIREKESTNSEIHIMTADRRDTFETANKVYDAVRAQQEMVVLERMKEELSKVPGMMEYTDLLKQMQDCPEFIACLTPSLTMLQRFLTTHKDIFWMKKDPQHTTRVGLCRNAQF